MSTVSSVHQRRCFQHNPYAFRLLEVPFEETISSNNNNNNNNYYYYYYNESTYSRAAVDFLNAANYMDDAFSSSPAKNFDVMELHDRMTSTEGEGGISDIGSSDETSRAASSTLPLLPTSNTNLNPNNSTNTNLNNTTTTPTTTVLHPSAAVNPMSISTFPGNAGTTAMYPPHPSLPSSSVVMPTIPSASSRAVVVRYASVNFRFGSAWFVAPFRTAVGEMVVVEYPHNGSVHLGLVSCITTAVPPTLAPLISPPLASNAGHVSRNSHTSGDGNAAMWEVEERHEHCPRLLRHARDFDRQTKLELRSHDLASLKSAQELAIEMQAPVTFLDAEWLLDLTAVTFLVNVWGDMTLVDKLADELAALEGAEVVFTYPALN
ncbi:hypothetical protein LSM04_005066 [Trypanosoma melophagium]|uniref:uncharacterized protein n=1 Tax=Trypanosoma melophagium TaxID=715481 RepID=UPI00351A3A84|nr:hypothetical protein LSM04_005066 [Trypanosoma melophagium]